MTPTEENSTAISLYVICRRCNLLKLSIRASSGRLRGCSNCTSVRCRLWNAAHPEKDKARQVERKANYDQHPTRAQRAARYAKQRQQAIDSARNWELANPTKTRIRKAEWRIANLEASRKRSRDWAVANPEKVRERNAARRAGYIGRFSADDIDRLRRFQKQKCANCRVDISGGWHVDHIQPVSKGGTNWPDNLQLLCKTCNLKKHDKDPYVWAQENGRLF